MGAKVLILITVAVAMLGMVLGASHTVGAPAGSWDLQTNYTLWASRRGNSTPGLYTCMSGDGLVLVVAKVDYFIPELALEVQI